MKRTIKPTGLTCTDEEYHSFDPKGGSDTVEVYQCRNCKGIFTWVKYPE